jgi:hypothetical protein
MAAATVSSVVEEDNIVSSNRQQYSYGDIEADVKVHKNRTHVSFSTTRGGLSYFDAMLLLSAEYKFQNLVK